LEVFTNGGGVYIYAENLKGKALVGCIANPRIVDALLEYALNEVENYRGEIK
jgi:hypothetical protein